MKKKVSDEGSKVFIDTHVHLYSEKYLIPIESIIAEASDCGVKKIVNISTTKEELEVGLGISSSFCGVVFNAAATHPSDCFGEKDDFFSIVLEKIDRGNILAIGETGLDYGARSPDSKFQKAIFIEYINLAKGGNLPIIIHCRNAFDDVIKILDSEDPSKKLKGVMHCFTGTFEEAMSFIDRGFLISFGGILTFKNGGNLRAVAKGIPMENIVIETDCPYLAPERIRGQINYPANVVDVAEKLAEIKGISVSEVASVTTKNAQDLFRI